MTQQVHRTQQQPSASDTAKQDATTELRQPSGTQPLCIRQSLTGLSSQAILRQTDNVCDIVLRRVLGLSGSTSRVNPFTDLRCAIFGATQYSTNIRQPRLLSPYLCIRTDPSRNTRQDLKDLPKSSHPSRLRGAHEWNMTLPDCRNEILLSLRSRIGHTTLHGDVGTREQVHIQKQGYRQRLKAARRLCEPGCYRRSIVFSLTSKHAAVIWNTACAS